MARDRQEPRPLYSATDLEAREKLDRLPVPQKAELSSGLDVSTFFNIGSWRTSASLSLVGLPTGEDGANGEFKQEGEVDTAGSIYRLTQTYTNLATGQVYTRTRHESTGTWTDWNSIAQTQGSEKLNKLYMSNHVFPAPTPVPSVFSFESFKDDINVNYYVHLLTIGDDGYLSAMVTGVGDIGNFRGNRTFLLEMATRRGHNRVALKYLGGEGSFVSYDRDQEFYYRNNNNTLELWMKYVSEASEVYSYPPKFNSNGSRSVMLVNSKAFAPAGLTKINITQ